MPHEIIRTEDGSTTLYVPELNEHYHSVHGAIQESLHIFIRAGIEHCGLLSPCILEAGFGTGLNAYLTLVHAHSQEQHITYHSFEKYPLSPEEVKALNYNEHINFPEKELFFRLHECEWNKDIIISPYFTLHKHHADFRQVDFDSRFDIVFYDAFNPDVQPHLWTGETFSRFYRALRPGGTLVTYCVKGIVKQALRSVGFTLKRLPGPPGKREMLRATKPGNSTEYACSLQPGNKS